jgi:FkbM family methyltransferase
MIGVLKRLLPESLKAGLKRSLFAVNDMTARLRNLRRAGFTCTGAIDGGAFKGEWSKVFWGSFPDVPVMLVEPQPDKAAGLRSVAESHASHFVPAALGKSSGDVDFTLGESNSRVASGGSRRDAIRVRMTTIDEAIREARDFHPNLLKLDLQGYELEALAGCSDLGGRFEVIILEVSILRIGDVPIFSEVDDYLGARCFRLYDVIPQYYRPLDGALWQCDAFYVRTDSNLIASREWA